MNYKHYLEHFCTIKSGFIKTLKEKTQFYCKTGKHFTLLGINFKKLFFKQERFYFPCSYVLSQCFHNTAQQISLQQV